jgi:SPP1 family predicted phage head-tail adaptor
MFPSLLNREFEHYRKTRTTDGYGGWEEVFVQLPNFRGRLRPVEGKEQEWAESQIRQLMYVLYTEANLDIRRGDKILIDDHELEVMLVREPSQAGHHLEIDCKEIQKENQYVTGS